MSCFHLPIRPEKHSISAIFSPPVPLINERRLNVMHHDLAASDGLGTSRPSGGAEGGQQ